MDNIFDKDDSIPIDHDDDDDDNLDSLKDEELEISKEIPLNGRSEPDIRVSLIHF